MSIDSDTIENSKDQIKSKSIDFLDSKSQDTTCLLFIDEDTQKNITNELNKLIEERKVKYDKETKNLVLRLENQKVKLENDLEENYERYTKLMSEEIDRELFVQLGGDVVIEIPEDKKSKLINKLKELNTKVKEEYELKSEESFEKIRQLIKEMNYRLNKKLEELDLATLIEYDEEGIKEVEIQFEEENINSDINMNVRKIKKLLDFKDLLVAEDTIKQFTSGIKETLEKVKNDSINPTLEKLSDKITEIENIFEKKSNEIEEKINTFLQTLKDEQRELKKKVREIIEKLKEELNLKLSKVKEEREKIIKEYEDIINRINNELENIILNNIKRLKSELDKNEENKKNLLEELKTKQEEDVIYLFTEAHGGLLYKWDEIRREFYYIQSTIIGFNVRDNVLLSDKESIKLGDICLKVD